MMRIDLAQKLARRIDACMAVDRRGFRRRLARLRRAHASSEEAGGELRRLEQEITQSAGRHARRRTQAPRALYPQALPLLERRAEIAEAITRYPVIVVCGETGSGKTTQLPKICLELGRGVQAMIGHTQPRRIAARSVATRIAAELSTEIGAAVGYQIRFSDRVGPDTYIKVMTDGILLAEARTDRWLQRYDTIILDEAHERSLNIDFLLGYLKRVLARRADLKLIIASATIDPERFSRHFDGAPIIEVSGRTYPVELRYRPLAATDENERERGQDTAIVEAVDELCALGGGDVLVFLGTEREIRDAAEALRKHHPPQTEILPLYARLSATEQDRIFQPHNGRRIVLATNVAETSLTVPGVRYVVDTGYARISRYSHRRQLQRLPIERIAQSSADQRKGRCGRVSAGVCIRLYSEQDYLARAEFTEPEILRTNLAGVVLQMKALGLGSAERFPFMDAPDPRRLKDAERLLSELGAVDPRGQLTPLGRRLARLPLDPRLGRMILAAEGEGCVEEVLIIASALSVQDPREHPLEARERAEAAHRQWSDPRSDFLALLKLWQSYAEQARHLSKNKQRAFCRDNFLSYIRIQNWRDIRSQLHELTRSMGLRPNAQPADYASIHRALLTGLLGNIACRGERSEYMGIRGTKLAIFPGSALAKKSPPWIVAAELVETARVYARTVAAVEPEWIERAAGTLCRRASLEPRWDERRAMVMASEQVSLYGLVLISGRPVPYADSDPQQARAIFIREALVHGRYVRAGAFLEHNRALVAELEELEHKQRRHDLLVNEERYAEFYDVRIPQDVCDGRSFERWWRQTERVEPRRLHMTREYLMRHGAIDVTTERFPERLHVNGMDLALSYRFEPGDSADGVTVTVPLIALNQLRAEQFEWLVPGLLREKLIALIRALPKGLRRNFVPATDFADACQQALQPSAEAFFPALTRELARMSGVTVPPEAWAAVSLAPHLHMNFRLIDADGRNLAVGRDLAALQRLYAGPAGQQLAQQHGSTFERRGIQEWDFGHLPERVELDEAGHTLYAYPALADESGSVALRLFDSPAKALRAMHAGLRRLFMLQLTQQLAYLRKHMPHLREACLYYAPIGDCEALRQDLIAAAIDRAFIGEDPWVRDAAQFAARLQSGRAELVPTANAMAELAHETLASYYAVRQRLADGTYIPAEVLADINGQLRHLCYPAFLSATPHRCLRHLPRYFKAILLRLDKLEHAPARDRQSQAQLAPLWEAYLNRRAQADWEDERMQDYRWLIEELRVSLFAQELGTALPVSVKRLWAAWQRITGGVPAAMV